MIRAIQVENFKSFKTQQTVEAGNKNIIIGKNGSGKSNLLSALANIFLIKEDHNPQYNSNDNPAIVKVSINNTSQRFPLPSYFSIKVVFKDKPEYFIDDKPVTKEELRGMFDNAGLNKESFVMQGTINEISTMSPKEKYELICDIAGVSKYESARAQALKCLDEEKDEKIKNILEKIELKTKSNENIKNKQIEYKNLKAEKAEIEFNLINWEIQELNKEIEECVVETTIKPEIVDESLIEFEVKEIRDEICSIRKQIEEEELYVDKFKKSTAEQIVKFNENNEIEVNPFDSKVESYSNLKEEKNKLFCELKEKESSCYVQLKALKYFDAYGQQREDVNPLKEQFEKVSKEIEEFVQNDTKEVLMDLIKTRKELWIQEKGMKDELEKLKTTEKNLESKILYLGKQQINIYDSIKNEPGVCGTVFSLSNVPSEILDAFEAVTKNSMFWIVVENDDVATKLIEKIEGRATFIALNRVKLNKNNLIEDPKLIKLSSTIKCDKKYMAAIEFVCKDFYIASDIKTAVELSDKYKINIVTMDGDLVNKNGVISGGFEQSNCALRDLKECESKIRKINKNLNNLKSEIEILNSRIHFAELNEEDNSRALENLKAFQLYLKWKITLLELKGRGRRGIRLLQTEKAESNYNEVAIKLPKAKLELEEVESQLLKYKMKKEMVDSVINKIKNIKILKDKVKELTDKESKLIDSLYLKSDGPVVDSLYLKSNGQVIDNETKRLKKHMLLEKRSDLLRKIGISDFKNLTLKSSKEELLQNLKKINSCLKNYYGFDKFEIINDQGDELREKLKNLKISKQKILEFIENLDKQKEDTLKLTFSMIASNFKYFFMKITEQDSDLVLNDGSVDIVINGQVADIKSLSGGQKTVIAISLILAIQMNDPSPYYVFDEIDANLDQNYCRKIYSLISESVSQYFITSFKEESLICGDKFFAVSSENKESFVAEVDRKQAAEIILF